MKLDPRMANSQSRYSFDMSNEDNQLNIKDIKYIKDKLRDIDQLLRGRATDAEPSGIVYQVLRNTQFRKSATKVLWILTTGMLGVVLHIVLEKI